MMTISPAGFRNDIQGIRAIAVALVVVYHAGVVLPGGFIGVDVFFVVSGFVITRMLLKEFDAQGKINFRNFYLRRIRRLLPALGLMLGVTLLLSAFLAAIAAQPIAARTGASPSLFNANTYLHHVGGGGGGYFGLNAEANPFLHTWSLAVEEQFYLVFPALLAIAWALATRFRTNHRAFLGVFLAAIGILSFVVSRTMTFNGGKSASFAFYYAPTRAWEFAAGAILALGALTLSRINTFNAYLLSVLGLAFLAWGAWGFDKRTPFPGNAALVPVVGTMLLIAAGESQSRNFITSLLGSRPMQKLGDLSYGWYLWHWPFIVFAYAVFPQVRGARGIAAALSIIPAVLSYRLVESPIRFRKNPAPRRTLLLGATCIVVPLIAAVALNTSHDRVSASSLYEPFALHEDVLRGCSTPTPMGMRKNDNCSWDVKNAKGTAVLIGDSNAGQFTEGFVAGANAASLNAKVATQSSCPFANLRLWDWSTEDTTCSYFVSKTLAHLIELKPQYVVIASASDSYIKRNYFTFRSSDEKILYTTPEEKALALQEGLIKISNILRYRNIKVIIVHPVPKFAPWTPIGMAPLRILGPKKWMDTSIPKPEALAARELALASEKTAAAESKATTLDFFDELCPNDPCSSLNGSEWGYRDHGHISIATSKSLADTFQRVLSE